jgi:hypothetical protein
MAMPKARRRDRQAALRQLELLKVRVRKLPAIEDVAAGRFTVSDLRPVGTDDLLGREPVPPDAALLARNIAGKSVLVTGAGGSIGSELVRQIVRQGPKRLVLLERSETALYEIDLEVDALLQAVDGGERPAVVAVLGSVLDAQLVRRTIEENGIGPSIMRRLRARCPWSSTTEPACATSTFGMTLVNAAAECGVERFVLISTDKAVRPTAYGRQQVFVRERQARRGRQAAHRVHHGAVRQRARQLGLGGAALPGPDRGGRAGDGHAPRYDPLLHVDPGSGRAGHPGRRHGNGRRRVRARHGRAGRDRRSCPVNDPADGARGARRGPPRRRYRHPVHRPARGKI